MLISPPDSWLRGVPVSPATSKPDLETALSLLEEHASKIRPIQVNTIVSKSHFCMKKFTKNILLLLYLRPWKCYQTQYQSVAFVISFKQAFKGN